MQTLYVPSLQPAIKHTTILNSFDALDAGETLLIINDHDPIPLYYEMKAEKGEVFNWNKIENGPDVWKVEITKTSPSIAEVPASFTDNPVEKRVPVEDILNVTLLEPKLKHPTIFKKFDTLKEGESMQILNDHDPKPLYYQMIAERGNIFTWAYNEQGPVWWKVTIRKNDVAAGETVGEIAAKDLRKAEVFKKFGIDFCCGGKKSLSQACRENGIDENAVAAALDNVGAARAANDYTKWEPAFLADYIYNQHHKYYYQEFPVIMDILERVVAHHGPQHPVLHQLYHACKMLETELNTHFAKEEAVVFPLVKVIAEAARTGNKASLAEYPALTEALNLMEADHEEAGSLLQHIRSLTDNYTVPEDGCNSYRLLYKKLEDMENDLHLHIHLENNILFPATLKLEKSL